VDWGPGFPSDGLRRARGHPFQGVVVLVLLSDWGPGEGGTVMVPGSHHWAQQKLEDHEAAEGELGQEDVQHVNGGGGRPEAGSGAACSVNVNVAVADDGKAADEAEARRLAGPQGGAGVPHARLNDWAVYCLNNAIKAGSLSLPLPAGHDVSNAGSAAEAMPTMPPLLPTAEATAALPAVCHQVRALAHRLSQSPSRTGRA
jgi:hypothetical protein